MTTTVTTTRKANYSAEEAAKYIGVSYCTIRRLVASGKLRRAFSLRKILIPAEDVENFTVKDSRI